MNPRGRNEIYFGETGQKLIHVPPVRVASATYLIEDLTLDESDANREIKASTVASVDSFSESTNAAAGKGETDATKVPMASPGSAEIGHSYQISDTSGDGHFEVFVVAAKSSTALFATAPLGDSYASGATVEGIELEADFPDATAADEDIFEEDRPIRIRWEYTLDGRKYVLAHLVPLIRYTHAGVELSSVEAQIRELWPELTKQLPEQADVLRKMVEYASRDVYDLLRARGAVAEQILADDPPDLVIYLRDRRVVPGHRATKSRVS